MLSLSPRTGALLLLRALQRPKTLHDVADAHEASIKTAVKLAFAKGRAAVDGKKLRAARTKADALRTVAGVDQVVMDALRKTLPGVMWKAFVAAGVLVVGKLVGLKTLEEKGHPFHGNQWTEDSEAQDERERQEAHSKAKAIESTVNHSGFMTPKELMKLQDAGRVASIRKYERKGLDELKKSISETGRFEPIVLRPAGNDKYIIEDGHHRLAAARELKLDKIPVRIGQLGSRSLEELRSAKREEPKSKLTFSFDTKNERAIAWAEEHAAELIDDLAETTKQAITDAIVRRFETGRPANDDILDALFEDEVLGAVGDEARANLIARTESMRAANGGQREAWNQAVDEGLLTGDEQRVWITTEVGACPQCEALDGKMADLDGEYEDGIEMPPAHPSCRCTEGLQP